jgi:hypothetical protein
VFLRYIANHVITDAVDFGLLWPHILMLNVCFHHKDMNVPNLTADKIHVMHISNSSCVFKGAEGRELLIQKYSYLFLTHKCCHRFYLAVFTTS